MNSIAAWTDSYFSGTLNNTLTAVKSGATYLYTLEIDNADSAKRYLQLFDAAATGDITLGTTSPTYVIGLASAAMKSVSFCIPMKFELGLVYAMTTGDTNATNVSAAGTLSVGYR